MKVEFELRGRKLKAVRKYFKDRPMFALNRMCKSLLVEMVTGKHYSIHKKGVRPFPEVIMSLAYGALSELEQCDSEKIKTLVLALRSYLQVV